MFMTPTLWLEWDSNVATSFSVIEKKLIFWKVFFCSLSLSFSYVFASGSEKNYNETNSNSVQRFSWNVFLKVDILIDPYRRTKLEMWINMVDWLIITLQRKVTLFDILIGTNLFTAGWNERRTFPIVLKHG